MALENAVDTAIYNQLASGTALIALLGGTAIYNGNPPRDVALPWVTFSLSGGVEDNQTPARTQRLVYLVKGVAISVYVAGQIAAQIDTLLHGAAGSLSISGGTAFWASRESVVRYQEIDPAGHVIGHAGGEYAFRVEG